MTIQLTNAQDQRKCYGLPADWLTGWMAAVGATVVDNQLRLSWTEDEVPVAMFSHQKGHDPVKSLSDVWPSLRSRLDHMPGARDATTNKNDYREINVKVFADRLAGARNHPDAFSLTSSLTDLHWEKSKEGDKAVYGPFETSGPGSTKWLHHRCRKVYSSVGDPIRGMEEMFDGVSQRIADNGLGLDAGRIGAIRDSGETQMVEPVAESLAYFALALFPVRGDGKQVQASRGRQRGWGVGPYRDWEFIWPAWRQPLDRWGIDALLTAWHNTWRRREKDEWRASRAEWDLLGVHAGWCTSRFKRRTSRDMTRGYGSRQIDA